MKSVAVIGQGFVGGSLTTVLAERGATVLTYDLSGKLAPGGQRHPSLVGLVGAYESRRDCSGIYFVCVPTPMRADGSADTSIVESVLEKLATDAVDRIVVVKSTIPPGTTEKLNRLFRASLHIVFNPEFLTEANALEDMRSQSRIVLGGPRPWINRVKSFYQTAFPSVPVIKTSSTIAEMVKYFTNIQLTARVILSCEMWEICEGLSKQGHDIDYDKVVEYAKLDPRLGGTHMNVPGNDGVMGARGHCFPKDLAALIQVAHIAGAEPDLLMALKDKNLKLVPRESRDWEKMIGRAVSA
jgi:UDPglucose 6-dehydrogenase